MPDNEPKEAIIVQPAGDATVLMPVMNIELAKQRLKQFQEFVQGYLVKGEDFGIIPGTPKPTLLKSGAEKLCEIYGLADDYVIESKVEDYSAVPELFDYTVKCMLRSRRDGSFVGAGFGSCNSYEGKYRWRESKRTCPLCGKATIIRGKKEYGGGWLCFAKKGGCGAKFIEKDPQICDQKEGKELNEDIPTQKNTILKIAKKRAKIDAVIAVTRSSGIFTQDIEDLTDQDTTDGSGTREAAQRVGQAKIEAHNASKAQQQASGEASTGEVVGIPKANISDMPEEAAPNQFGPLTERKLTKTGHLKLRLDDGEPLMVWKDQKVRRGGKLVHVSEIIKCFLADEHPFCDFEIEQRIPEGNGKPYWAVRGVRQIGNFKWDDDGTEILDVNDERNQSLWPKGDR